MVQTMAKSKQQLFAVVQPLEEKAGAHNYLAGGSLSVADVAAMVDLRTAFEKVRSLTNLVAVAPGVTC